MYFRNYLACFLLFLFVWYCFQNFVSIKIKILETLMAPKGDEGNLGTKLYNLHYDTNTPKTTCINMKGRLFVKMTVLNY